MLVTALFTATLIATYVTVTMTCALGEIRSANRFVENAQTFHLTEAGVDLGLIQLNQNPQFRGDLSQTYSSNLTVTADAPIGTPQGTVRIRSIGTSSTRAFTRALEVYVVQEGGPLFTHAAFAENYRFYMQNRSYTDSYDSRLGRYEFQIPGENGDVGTNNCGAVDNCNGGTLADGVTTAGAGTASVIRVHGNSVVHGDAYIGPGYRRDPNDNAGIRTLYGGVITGQRRILDQMRDIPFTVDVPTGVFEGAGSCTTLDLRNNDTATFGPGTYCFNSIALRDSAQVRFTGDVTVYTIRQGSATGRLHVRHNAQVIFDGKATVHTAGSTRVLDTAQVTFHDQASVYTSGNFLTDGNAVFGPADQRPTKLELIHTVNDNFRVSGNSKFYGTIFAPEAKVTVGWTGDPSAMAEVFGAVIAHKIVLGGEDDEDARASGAIHFDEALQDPDLDVPMTSDEGGGKLKLIYWKQTQ